MFGNMAHKAIEGKLLGVGHLGDFTEHDLAHAMDAIEKQWHALEFNG
jgi:aspartate aminotransferase-like enzyme